jgi:hypothetical protein
VGDHAWRSADLGEWLEIVDAFWCDVQVLLQNRFSI